jgi:predicted protein tyrosine phosphatase
MRVKAIPKVVFQNKFAYILSQPNVAVISILDTDAKRIVDDIRGKVLTVWFDDIHPKTTMTLASCMDCKAADFDDAKKIINFIKTLPPEIDFIFVHCTAGICRSGAVVDFLRVVLDVDDVQFVSDNPGIIPNDWVLDLLWMTWKMKGKL